MKKLIIFLQLLNILLFSCQKQSKVMVENGNMKNNSIMSNEINILQKQLAKGLKATIGDAVDYQIEYTDEDLDIEGIILENILRKNGFKDITPTEFQSKVKSVFNREIEFSSNKNFLYLNNFSACDRTPIYYQNNGIDYNGMFLFKNNRLIAPLFTIPELIDYHKNYPDIINFEKKLPTEFNTNSGDLVKVRKWMNEKDLQTDRYNNIQIIVARNKYLFNDSKADFVWLKVNDKDFLESLVKTFGYTMDEDLLEFVLKDNYKDESNLEVVLWNQLCDGNIKVNKEVFEIVKKWDAKDATLFSHKVQAAMNNMLKRMNEDKSISFINQAKALGLIAYYATKTDPNKYYSFFPILNDPDFDAEFKKASYYNISDFKEIYEETRYGGIGQAE